MDLNERIDRLEGELKIIKNEVKQVLLDIKEQILSTYANPFPREIQITEKPAAKSGGPGVALGREKVAEKEGVVEAKQEQPGGVGGGGQVAPARGGVGGQPQQVGVGPLPASTGAISGPHFIPEQNIGKEGLEGRISSSFEESPEPEEGKTAAPSEFGEERPILGKRPVEKAPPAQGKEDARRPLLRSRSESEAVPGEEELDLAMLIKLARWAEESVKKVGREKVERLLEIYQGTKHLPQGTKEIILGLVHLVDEGKPEGQVTIKSCIGMLLQLDGILGGNKKEQALLSLLLGSEEGELWTKL